MGRRMTIKREALIIVFSVLLMLGLVFIGLSWGKETEVSDTGSHIKMIHVWGGVPESAGPAEVIKNFNEEFAGQGIQAKYCYYTNTESGNKGMENTLLSGRDVDVYFTYDMARLESRAASHMAEDLALWLERDQINLQDFYNSPTWYSYLV